MKDHGCPRVKTYYELNEDQKAICTWLKDCYKESGDPTTTISELYDETRNCVIGKTCLEAAFETLDSKQQFEVLAVFAQWGLFQEVAE